MYTVYIFLSSSPVYPRLSFVKFLLQRNEQTDSEFNGIRYCELEEKLRRFNEEKICAIRRENGYFYLFLWWGKTYKYQYKIIINI